MPSFREIDGSGSASGRRANPKSTWFGILPHSRKVLKLMEERHEPQTILACNASDPKCPGRAYRRLRSHRRPFDLDDSQEFGGLDAAAQTNRRYRVCRGPADRHDLTPSVWVDWPLRPRDSRMGHHLCGVTGKPSRRSGRQGPYFRSSGLARDDDLLHALGRPWLIRAVDWASGDGGDACSSPCLRCGSGRGLRLARHQTEFGRQLFPLSGARSAAFKDRRKDKAVVVGETAGVEAETDRLLGAAVPTDDGELDLMNAGALYQAHSV